MKSRLEHIHLPQLLRWAFFFLLFGYALKFLNGKGPFLVFGVQDPFLNQCAGVMFLLFSVGIWSPKKAVIQSIACLSFVALMTDSIVAFQQAGYVPEQLIEHATKLLLPLLFITQEFSNWNASKQEFVLKIIVALTFIGHGLFAISWHFTPGNFHTMTTSILGVTGNQSTLFLRCVGILDFAAAFCLFLPKKFQWIALHYLMLWGLLTALARVVSPIRSSDFDLAVLYDGLIGTLHRLPHALLPLWLFAFIYRGPLDAKRSRVVPAA